MKKLFGVLIIAVLFASALPLYAQVLAPSNVWYGTRGLELSDWDRIYFPSYSGEIEKNFIYVPFTQSIITSPLSVYHYTAGTSFVLGPFRVFGLGDIHFDSQKYVNETESYDQQYTLVDTNADGIADTYQYSTSADYSYSKNSLNQGTLYFSPGLAFNLGPFTIGARYIFQKFNNNNVKFEYSELVTITDSQTATNNVATTSDQEITLRLRDSGMINGFTAGTTFDFGFLRLQGDLFATLQNIGRYDATSTDRTHLISGLGDPDFGGATADYVETLDEVEVENGYLGFGGLGAGSTIFNRTGGQRFEYTPAVPAGGLWTLPPAEITTIHAPQVVTDVNLITEGELFGFVVPFWMGLTTCSLTKDSFVSTRETTNYASATLQLNYTKTTETLSLTSDANREFYTKIGILKRFFGNPLSFQVGATYTITTGRYHMKITQKVETLTQVDNSAPGDGDYTDSGVDTNTTQVQDGWYKAYDYRTTYSTFSFPVSFLFNITRNFEFFGGVEFMYDLGKEKDDYVDTGQYLTDQTTENNTGAVTNNLLRSNYDTEPVFQYTVTSINNFSTTFLFGLRYFFNENLIFVTQLLTAEPTVDTGAGSLFANTLIAELNFRFGKK